MEITDKQNSTVNSLSILGAVILIVGGFILMGYLLSLTRTASGLTGIDFFLYAGLAYIPIIAGGVWLGTLHSKHRANRRNAGIHGGILAAVLLIVTGLVILAFSAGLLPAEWKKVWISWQMLLIVVGVIELCKRHMVQGFSLIIAGTFFIAPRVMSVYPYSWDIDGNFTRTYWPVLLIAVGVMILVSLLFRRKTWCHTECHDKWSAKHAENARTSEGKIDYDLIFTGIDHVVLDPVFRGGEISTVFGGGSLDLRRTTLPEGTTLLEVEAVFGGVTIYIPDSWNVELKSSAVFGGFQDNRPRVSEITDPGRKLLIVSSCVFGGGEIK